MLKAVVIGHVGHLIFALEAIEAGLDCVIDAYAPSPNSSDEGYAKKLGAKYYDDYITMLENEKPDVAIVNPEFNHISKCTVECLKRDINIFCEKPLAITERGYKNVVEAQRGSKARLCAMMGMRYEAAFYKLHEIIKEGTLGNIRLIHAQKSYKLGRRMDFYKKRATYGGTIPWVGSHPIDLIYWLSQRAKFKTISAHHSKSANAGHGDLEATAAILFKMENELIATVNIDYLRPNSSDTHGDDRIRIVGEKAWAEIVDGKLFLDGAAVALPDEINIFKAFCDELCGKGKCSVSNEDSLYVTKIGLLARESADSGKIIDIED